MGGETKPGRAAARRRRVGMLIAVVLAAAGAAYLDQRLKSSETLGFYPRGSDWVVVSRDIAGFANGVLNTAAYDKARAAAPLPRENWPLDVRKATGIRPTPARWRVWMGDTILAAGGTSGRGICLRPGLLLRVASALRGAPEDGAVSAFGDYHYAWREGFLVVSRSPEYVRACLAEDAVESSESPPPSTATFAWFAEPAGSITIEGADALPVKGRLNEALTTPRLPLTLATAWPVTPMVSIAGADPGDVFTIARDSIRDLPLTDYFDIAIEAMAEELPEQWASEGAEYAFGLMGLDLSEELPVPVLALLLRGDTAGVLPPRPADAVPFEWQGGPGWLRPWLGPKLSVCVGAWERTRYITSREPLMPQLFRRLAAGPAVSAHAAVDVQWEPVARAMAALLLQAGRQELLPGMNEADVDRAVIPYLERLAALGRCRLTGISDESETVFRGYLAAPAE